MNKLKKTININLVEKIIRNKVFVILVFLAIALSIYEPIFYSPQNLMNVLRQVTVSAIVAVGFTFVLAIGSIDLSVGSQVGMIGILIGYLLKSNFSVLFVSIFGIIGGILLGWINAAIISRFDLAPFIVTLGMSSIIRGAGYIMTHMEAIYGFPNAFNNLGKGYLLVHRSINTFTFN